jgi:nicotinamide phosphoribosyltransferase
MNTEASPIAPLLMTDAYKIDHRRQYPEGTEYVYSNYTNRGSRIPGVDSVVHFGLQAFLQDFCIDAFKPFFEADEEDVCNLYTAAINSIIGPNEVGTDHIRALHRKGYLPLRFSAVPEGTLVPLRVPSFTIENTDPEFFWLTNFVETVVSAAVWHPSTVATIAHQYRVLLEKAAKDTGGDIASVDYQLHDFSYRGQVGSDAAAISALGHLLSFKGSDTLLAYDYADRFYNDFDIISNRPTKVVLASVPATEHSVMCAGGMDDEFGTYDRLLDIYPSGIVSIVSDTWDLWNVLTDILPRLKKKIMARDGKVVIRPDSGDPVDILCGLNSKTMRSIKHIYEYGTPNGTPADKGVIELLWDEFGGTVNEKGYRVLDSHIGAIYGDSITLDRAKEIVKRLEMKGFASTNVVFGVGSYSYQYVTRDTFGSAMKATWVQIKGEGKAIQKSPVTDSGLKKSATGRLAVLPRGEGGMALIENASHDLEAASLLQPVWEDGEFLKYQSLEDVRAVLASQR